MREIIVSEKEAGQRLDKLLGRCLCGAPKSFLYKMLRKKNITLNGKKAAGGEQIQAGDRLCFYLSDETFEKFSQPSRDVLEYAADPLPENEIVYEDDHILIADKPSGVLSQKGSRGDVSVNEQILAYLAKKGEVTRESLRAVRPSVCNRLDRNTSGLVIFGKSLAGLQTMSELLRKRSLHKYYLCLVRGKTKEKLDLDGVLKKDEAANKVSVSQESDGLRIRTECTRLWTDGRFSLLRVWLITGRPHQIRAHLSSAGHPIAGDPKYGDPSVNREFGAKYGVRGQLLHAQCVEMPDDIAGELSYLSGKIFLAPLPQSFARVAKALGIPESVYARRREE